VSELHLQNVTLAYGALKALDDVTLKITNGEFFGLLGPSGSGKTTLLRVIAGFIYADSGSVRIDDVSVGKIPVEKRGIGMVFQNYALFPNMSVTGNVEFGLRVRNMSTTEKRKQVADVLALVQLEKMGDRRPHQLSGGQKQRVALARAIVTQPRVLLLDEPLSALDKSLRVEMQIELKRIQRETGITTIFVTHDQEEALMLSDRIGILREGTLVQSGSPRDVYHQPINEFTASFLGEANVFTGIAEQNGLRLANGELIATPKALQVTDTTVAVRPEYMTLSKRQQNPKPDINQLQVTLTQRVFAGAMVTCVLDWQGQTLKVLARDHELIDLPEHGVVWVHWPREKTMMFTNG